MSRTIAVVLSALLPACAGGSSSGGAPTAPPSAQPSPFPAGTVLTVVSADTSRPVVGASVVVSNRSYATNINGEITLTESAGIDSILDIVADGYLDRQTLLRGPTEVRFTLWPRANPVGLSESFVREIVYSSGLLDSDPANLGIGRLYRPGANRLVVYTPPEVQADSAAIEILREATEHLSAATDKQVVFSLTTDTNAPNMVKVTIDPSRDPTCALQPGCVNAGSDRTCDTNGYIIGGAIIFDKVLSIHRQGTAIHELGHVFGLGHTTARGVMQGPNPGNPNNQYADPQLIDFTEREKLVMKLMLQRRAGQRWPDNDRGITQISSCSNTR